MNSLVPPLVPGTRDGNWIWDGTRWVCDPDCDQPPQPCPPFSVLQPGGRHHSPFFPPPVTQPPWYPGANGGVSFSPPGQPPPNPIRGAFWWDGTSLWVFDGAAWDVVGAGSGAVVTPPGTSFPKNPAPGEQFFDGHTLWIWDGNAWVPVAGTKTYVQATAPPAPNPGDLWFDGTQLRIWSGSAWNLVGPGATVGPVPTTTQVFSLTMAGGLSLGANTVTLVPFTTTPIIDTMQGWNPTTHQFMPTLPGAYMSLCKQWAHGVGGYSAGHLTMKNDNGTYTPGASLIVQETQAASTAGIDNIITTNGMVHLNGTTDYLRYWAWSTDGSFPDPGISLWDIWLMA